jgi:hypothetical protein
MTSRPFRAHIPVRSPAPPAAAAASIEALIRGRGLLCRTRPVDHAAPSSGEPPAAHHHAVVWDPSSRLQGTGWSDRSVDAALAAALDAFLAREDRETIA